MHVCMCVSERKIEKLNISSPFSQHSGVPDFLITVFQSTSYDRICVGTTCLKSYGERQLDDLMVFPLVFNSSKSAENKMNSPTRQTVGIQLHR